MAVSYQLVIDCADRSRSRGSGLRRWATSSLRRRRASTPGMTSTGRSACPKTSWAPVPTASRIPRRGAGDLVPGRAREQDDQEPPAHRHQRQRRPRRPLEARRQRVDAEAARLVALGATRLPRSSRKASTTTRSPWSTPRATSSTSTDSGQKPPKTPPPKSPESPPPRTSPTSPPPSSLRVAAAVRQPSPPPRRHQRSP